MNLSEAKSDGILQSVDWWHFEPPPTPYDLVGNNFITKSLRPFLYIMVRLYFKHRHRLSVIGWQTAFAEHPFIIVANHSSHLDTLIIFSCFPFHKINGIRAVAALDYFFVNPVLRVFAHLLCNIIPISRKSSDFIAFSMCERTLKTGGTIIIYPEGTRTRDGKTAEFKPGIGILVQKTKFPVIPVFIEGSYKCFNYKKSIPSSAPIEIKFGVPLRFNEPAHQDCRTITQTIRNAVIEMS
jgi:1-acyl-sn-glycerol-3-phosphate acyltransferase